MITFRTTTNIVPIIDVGTYDSLLSWDGMWEPDAYSERHDEGNYVCDDYDSDKFKKKIVSTANDIFKREAERGDLLQEYGVKSIVATSMMSPREYNFMTDWLNLEVTVEDDFLDRAEEAIFNPEYRKAIDDCIRDNWCSRDGFSSMMPCTVSNGNHGPGEIYDDPYLHDMHNVIQGLREGNDNFDSLRNWGAVLMLLFVIKGQQESGNIIWGERYWSDLLVEDLRANTSLGDFCTILTEDEVEKLYGKHLFFGQLDSAIKQLKEGQEKYANSGVSEEAVERVGEEVKSRISKIEDYRERCRYVVELYHPGHPEKVKEKLFVIREEWNAEFGDFPTRAKLGKPDLPGQMVMKWDD